jgi:hypothetical protein
METRLAWMLAVCAAVGGCGGQRPAELEAAPDGAAQTRASCVPIDTSYRLEAAVYNPCAVDRVATVRSRPPRRDFRPTGSPRPCYRAIVKIVVDEDGQAVPGTTRLVRSTDPEFAQASVNAILATRYHPAERAGVAVKQVVTEDFRVVTVVRVRGEMAPPPRPNTNC